MIRKYPTLISNLAVPTTLRTSMYCQQAENLLKAVVNSLGARKIDSFRGKMLLTPSVATESDTGCNSKFD